MYVTEETGWETAVRGKQDYYPLRFESEKCVALLKGSRDLAEWIEEEHANV